MKQGCNAASEVVTLDVTHRHARLLGILFSISQLSCNGAHPREYSIGFTDHNLHISSSVRYLVTTQGMSSINSINIESYCKAYIKTCKALELATRKRIVWIAVLHRVCLENTLFLQSFPIPDMSDLELERAAMAPRRWIKLCGAFQKHYSMTLARGYAHEQLELLRTRMGSNHFSSCQVGDTW